VSGRRVRVDLSVPKGATRPIRLMPIFRALTDVFVEAAVENAQAEGHSISCRKGCGACCRQLVPISEVEVEALRETVRALSAERRAEVVARFEDAVRRLAHAGLLDRLRAPRMVRPDEMNRLGIAYFEQGIACPFLEDESCSIHAERPLACREYLVVSPPARCAHP